MGDPARTARTLPFVLLALDLCAGSSPAYPLVAGNVDFPEFIGAHPALNLFPGDESGLRSVQLVEDIENIPSERQSPPVLKILIKRKKRQW